ncbi:hypothetical protein GYMLUDRAFT_60957 [Collybiopsis luxurians FD-317 M1]|uniref:Uncharacterized protein n=1 Tax=Collybiopsis luxurians FD-317 M1 TaxID=944289 RepID=A0A0D0BRK8_9AGAR|nr:hypothetical protein GYMLUDRAFT_60957 [Collybiopsis luxurians FD-317 M1]
MPRTTRSTAGVLPFSYELAGNDSDWVHQYYDKMFLNPRLLNLEGVPREHSLYAPTNARLTWIFPTSARFMTKPQALFMPEVAEVTDLDDPDTSMASIEAQDADLSIDSMGGTVVSHQRNVFFGKGRKEIDFIVTKVMHNFQQVILVVVELKRDNLRIVDATQQIEEYFSYIGNRNNASQYRKYVLRGLLILGSTCIRIEGRYMKDSRRMQCVYIDGYQLGKPEIPRYLLTCVSDSVEVNEWLLNSAKEWETVRSVPNATFIPYPQFAT